MTQEGQRQLDDSECAGGGGGGQGPYDLETRLRKASPLMPSIVKCGATTPIVTIEEVADEGPWKNSFWWNVYEIKTSVSIKWNAIKAKK
jgi:hypothetical protein